MDDLIAFLRARLDDDVAAARAAKPGPWHSDGGDVYASHPTDEVVTYTESADHIARHDPARVLAEVDAKRRVLDYAEQRAAIKQGKDDDDWENIQEATLGTVLRFLTLPYAAHPDYRDAWRP